MYGNEHVSSDRVFQQQLQTMPKFMSRQTHLTERRGEIWGSIGSGMWHVICYIGTLLHRIIPKRNICLLKDEES